MSFPIGQGEVYRPVIESRVHERLRAWEKEKRCNRHGLAEFADTVIAELQAELNNDVIEGKAND